jgi:Icc-related predicted phosphoesterase
VDIDEKVVEHNGLAIAGLEGCMRYKPGPYQYTQLGMRYKAFRLSTRMLFKRRQLDILITHAPPFGIHDGRDLCHTGFYVFLQVMERHRPRYLLHGHSHVYNRLQTTMTQYQNTLVVNVHPYRVLEIPTRGTQN